jgi:hypothetical protein
MSDIETNPIEARVLFLNGGDSFTVRDAVDAAYFRGELQPVWENLLRTLAAERQAEEQERGIDDTAVNAAAERFRYEHDLITAEETEHWLQERGLTLTDFSNYFVRHYWANEAADLDHEPIDYLSASDEFRELFTIELILSGELDRMVKRLSWRVAANHGNDSQVEVKEGAPLRDSLGQLGRDDHWLQQMLSMEAAFRRVCDGLLSRQARAREIAALRLPLTCLDVETIELDSLDAAREALLCARDDGMSLEEVAAEGRYPYRQTDVLLEDVPEELQPKFLSVSSGEMLEPIARGDGFHLCRVVSKREPDLDDPVVKERAEKRILERYFEDLTAKHIQWRSVLP